MHRLTLTFLLLSVTSSLKTLGGAAAERLGEEEEDDPCLAHRVLDNPHRSPFYQPREPRDVICDQALIPGWYRFLANGGNAEIPQTCSRLNYCGTHAPVWLKLPGGDTAVGGNTSTLERTSEVQALACVTGEDLEVNSEPLCCMYSWPIRVRRCEEQGFTVYHLQPTTACNMGYCAQPENSSLPFVGSPKILPVVRNNNILLNCSFTPGPDFEEREYQISWFKVTQQYGAHVSLASEGPTMARHALLDVTQFLQPGDEVQCEVELHSEERSATSLPFAVGLTVSPATLNLTQGGPKVTLSVTKTLPLACTNNADCGLWLHLHVMLGTEQPRDPPPVALSSCRVFLPDTGCSSSGSCGTVEVQLAAVPGALIGHGHVTVQLEVASRTWAWWTEHAPTNVTVELEDAPSLSCHVFTLSHVTTFGRQSFDLREEGDYVLYQQTEGQSLQVQGRFSACQVEGGGGGVCLCGVVAREGNTLVSMDKCGAALPTVSVRELTTAQETGVRVLESRQGKVLSFVFGSGVMVRTHNSAGGLSLTVRSAPRELSLSHKLKVGGLCGGVENVSHLISELPAKHRLQDGESLFDIIPELETSESTPRCGCNLDLASSNQVGCPRVPCEQSSCPRLPIRPGTLRSYVDITEEVVEASERFKNDIYRSFDNTQGERLEENGMYFEVREMPLPHKAPGTSRQQQQGIGRGIEWDVETARPSHELQDALSTVTTPPSYVTSFPTASGLTEEDVHMACLSTLANSSIGIACRHLVTPDALMSIIEQCVTDVVRAESISWAQYSVPLLEDMCELSARHSMNTADRQLSEALSCPGLCSGHGVCLELGCICEPGFSKDDCSVLSELSPTITTAGVEGRCDILTHEGCNKIPVQGDGYARAESLVCRVRIPAKNNETMETSTEYVTTNQIRCLITNSVIESISPLEELLLFISVSNTGLEYSEERPVVVYNSKCLDCTSNGSCSPRSDICVINDKCFAFMQHKPGDICHKCVPKITDRDWSSVNSPPKFTIFNDTPTAISLRVFTGQEFMHQFTATDPEGGDVTFHLSQEHRLYLPPTLTPNGVFTWRIPESETLLKLTVVASDVCNTTANLRVLVVVNKCPCVNGGTCVTSRSAVVSCMCRRSFYGQRCERQENPCSSSPCAGRGRCVADSRTRFSCRCEPGYMGPQCTLPLHPRTSNPCHPSPCPRGATCLALTGRAYRCSVCPFGWRQTGQRCEPPQPPRTCVPACRNGGRCVGPNTCVCSRGWSGPNCLAPVCERPCMNRGVCRRPNRCSCPQGYRGRRCNKPMCDPSCLGPGLKCVAPNICLAKAAAPANRNSTPWQQNSARKTYYYRSQN